MKFFHYTISFYWKCQLIGWTLYALIPIIFLLSSDGFTPIIFLLGNMGRKLVVGSPVGIGSNADLINTYLLSIILKVIFLGLLISHLMRWVIIKLNILILSFSRQILSFLILSSFFSLLFLLSLNLSVDPAYILGRMRHSFNEVLTQGVIFCGAFMIWNLIYFLYHFVKRIREEEQTKVAMKIQILELEAKALRAQMNPHFVFNSLNSIKTLINRNENDIAAHYLTTFSKLIRTLFQNSTKREVSLFDELQTCRHYTQLEKMRFGEKLEFVFNVDESLDLKDIQVPALILQPIIENAIWHGLMPKETNGKVTVTVRAIKGAVECIIDDDGIGRELSKYYKAQYESTHESKGIGLTQSRLELDKVLNEREESILIIDKISQEGKPTGTRVIITFNENRN